VYDGVVSPAGGERYRNLRNHRTTKKHKQNAAFVAAALASAAPVSAVGKVDVPLTQTLCAAVPHCDSSRATATASQKLATSSFRRCSRHNGVERQLPADLRRGEQSATADGWLHAHSSGSEQALRSVQRILSALASCGGNLWRPDCIASAVCGQLRQVVASFTYSTSHSHFKAPTSRCACWPGLGCVSATTKHSTPYCCFQRMRELLMQWLSMVMMLGSYSGVSDARDSFSADLSHADPLAADCQRLRFAQQRCPYQQVGPQHNQRHVAPSRLAE